MINEFDRPAQSNIINTYTPIPFQELAQAAQIKRNDYEQGMNTLAKTYEDTYNLKYIPGSKDEQYIRNYVIPTVKETVNKYQNMDLSNPTMVRQMQMELGSKIDKNAVQKIQDSYSGWQQHQTVKQKLASEGKLAPDSIDYGKGYDTNSQGVYSATESAYIDPISDLQDRYFKPLKDTTIGTPHTDYLGNRIVRSGVTQGMISDVVKANLMNEMSTPTGQRLIKNYRSKYGLTEDKASDAQVLQKAFTDAGKPFVRQNENLERLNIDEASLPSHQKAPKDPGSKFFELTYTPTGTVKGVGANPDDFVAKTGRLGFQMSDPHKLPVYFKNEATYDHSSLNKPEVKALSQKLPRVLRTAYANLTLGEDYWNKQGKGNEYKQWEKQVYPALEKYYRSVDQNPQGEALLAKYYPDKGKEGTAAQIFNTETQTKNVFGSTKLASANASALLNTKAIDAKTGEVMSGTDFNTKVIQPALKKNKDAQVRITGEYQTGHRFSRLTNDPDFLVPRQAVIGGNEYIIAGPALDLQSPEYKHQQVRQSTYDRLVDNQNMNTDLSDIFGVGTTGISRYQSDGKGGKTAVFGIRLPDGHEVINTNFASTFEDALEYEQKRRR